MTIFLLFCLLPRLIILKEEQERVLVSQVKVLIKLIAFVLRIFLEDLPLRVAGIALLKPSLRIFKLVSVLKIVVGEMFNFL